MNAYPRIAMYIWHFSPVVGGAEQQCRILSEELTKNGASVFIITERVQSAKAYEFINGVQIYRISGLNRLRRLPGQAKNIFNLREEMKSDKIFSGIRKNRLRIIKAISQTLTHAFPNFYFFLASLWFLYKKRKEFDIIHVHAAHWIAFYGVTIARLLKKRVIVKEVISGKMMTFRENPVKLRKHLVRADIFVAISNSIFADLISVGVPRGKIKKVPNGVEVKNERWKFNGSVKRPVISVAKLDLLSSHYKGLDILMEAWGILVRKHQKRDKIIILGRGDPYRMSQLAQRLGIRDYIEFPGFRSDVKKHLLGSSLFVLPSREEGLSNALLEAMSLGLPCIATDISGNHDLIQSGTNGLLVPSGNPVALADAILFMLDNPDKASSMGRHARSTIEREYDISLVARQYIDIYLKLRGVHD